MPFGDLCPASILGGNRQHIWPIERGDVSLAIVIRDSNAKQPVPRGDIEHAQRLLGISADQARK